MHNFKKKFTFKPKQFQRKFNQQQQQQLVFTPKKMVSVTYNNIMKEIQSKNAGMFEFRTYVGTKGHLKLLRTMGQLVIKRLIELLLSNDNITRPFLLSQAYRKKHPHCDDFQLILSTLHQVQDEEGEPRLEIEESELTTVHILPYVLDMIPYAKVKATCTKYVQRITSNVMDHVNNLSMEVDPNNDPVEEAARIKVREQMKKLAPHLPEIIEQIVEYQFPPKRRDIYVVRIYGEPFLPGKEVMAPWLERYTPREVKRDQHMYNLLLVRVPSDALLALLAADGTLVGRYHTLTRHTTLRDVSQRDQHMYNLLLVRVPSDALLALLAADGTLVGGAMLVIRPNDVPFYRTPVVVKNRETDEIFSELEAIEEACSNKLEQIGP